MKRAAALIAVCLAMPAMAQTMQSTPTSPAAPSISPAARAPSAASTAQTPAAMVDINHATATELDALPGIGKARADAIVKNWPYKAPDELVDRHIIPKNVYDGIRPKIVARPG